MRRQTVISSLTALMFLLSSSPAQACGDKLLVLGQGVRFQIPRSENPGTIILFRNPTISAQLDDDDFQKIMKQAGHSWKSVTTWDALMTELKAGADLVIADFSDAPALEERIKTLSSRAVVLPWVYAEPGADKAALKKTKAAAQKQYPLFLERGIPRVVMSRVEKSLEKKVKLARNNAGAGTKQL